MRKGLLMLVIAFFVAFTYSWSKLPLQRTVLKSSINDKIVKLVNNPIGVWEYTVFGAEAPYDKGVLFVKDVNGVKKVDVQLRYGTLTGQDVEVNDNTIKFNINIEGIERVSVVLLVAEDDISGEAYSNQGTFKIQGKRKLPPQKG